MMKRHVYLFFIVLAGIGLILTFGCEGDDGKDGLNASEECFEVCHSDDFSVGVNLQAYVDQWDNSFHGEGATVARGSSSSCAPCHADEGFTSLILTGTAEAPDVPTKIDCFTCHKPHERGDFELVTEAPVMMVVGEEEFDFGASNLCANCHQARSRGVPVPFTGDVEVTSTHWGPHHSPQANMLAGIGGHEYAGVSYPNSFHTIATASADGCVSCHMAEGDLERGGHAWNMNNVDGDDPLVSGCNVAACHDGDVEDFDYRSTQAEIVALAEELATKLEATGALHDGHAALGTYSADIVGALHNYLLVVEDRSVGFHNTRYAKALLQSSIDALDALP